MFDSVKLSQVETKTFKYNHYRLLHIFFWKYKSLGKDHSSYPLKLSDLKSYLGVKENKQIVDLVQKLSKSYIKFSDSEDRNLGFCSVVSNEIYIENDTLYFNLPERLKILIDSERVHNELCFNGTLMFKNKFAKDLYFLTKETSEDETEWIDVEDFKEFLAVPDKKTYQNFKNVGSKIISPSISEINTFSDLNLVVEYIADDNGIKSVRFKIEKKDPEIVSQLVTWEKPEVEENPVKNDDDEADNGDSLIGAKLFLGDVDDESLSSYKIGFIEMIKNKKMVYQRFQKYGYNDVLIKNVFLQYIRDNVLSKAAS
ncbi:MAG: replication initiation protein [Proteobacteria bacterium]|nr:replication initiation protein [Pseudomonadota bacterium]